MGDFNLREIKWDKNDEGVDFLPIIGDSTSERATIARIVTNNMIQKGYSQLNNIENVSHNVLDLIYSNEPELMLVEPAISRLIAKELSDPAHHPLNIILECEPISYPADKKQLLLSESQL